MNFLKKTVAFFAVLSVFPAGHALTARPSIVGGASARLPNMSTRIINSSTTSATTSTTAAALLANAECIDAYTECMKADDVCGPNFEECTTNKLFHGQMPKCISVLSTCSASGVNSLFGTSNIGALSTVKTTDSTTGEVLEYTYPAAGSVMEQWITAAAISNKYDKATCLKRYESCLHKDSVCGEDFELCTSEREFRKQALYCDSTLARCEAAGVYELFGVYSWTPSTSTIGGRVKTMIEDGASLAALNAVQTCYKVVEQCFLGACTANPFRCIEGSTLEQVTAANKVDEGEEIAASLPSSDVSKSDVNRYLRTACLDTIGSNKYCHMTFREKTPTNRELSDPEYQEEVFDAARDQRKPYIMSKIQDVMEKFDTKVKNKCVETIRTCAMRTCGEGVGSVCYTSVFNGTDESINKTSTRDQIKRGCEAVVNTDTNCQYAFASVKNQAYSYSYIQDSAFNTLFPEYDSMTASDPIGVVASLNASLANNYSKAAIEQMRKQCQSIASSCVRTMCGDDFQNCYRNRTDVYSDLTSGTGTGSAAFNKSMNKVGGVLDYTIALGLCINTVKDASICDEHLKIEKARLAQDTTFSNSWGSQGSVRDGWIDAGGVKTVNTTTDEIQSSDANGNQLCTNKKGEQGVCYTVDASGNVFDTPVMESVSSYLTTQAANTLFRELITDLEYEAQAKYNAKLTQEQNMCYAQNSGGIQGRTENGSTFMWAKLRNGRVPTNYATAGLSANQFVASNDLYGSFCRVRVTLQSDDKRIQDILSKNNTSWGVAYFAVGDAFTCGSWIPGSALNEIANAVAKEATASKEAAQDRTRDWLTILGVVGGGVGGGYLTDSLQDKGWLGGLMGKTEKKDTKKNAESCKTFVTKAESAVRNSPSQNDLNNFHSNYTLALQMLSKAGKSGEFTKQNDLAQYENLQYCIVLDKGVETFCQQKGTGEDVCARVSGNYCTVEKNAEGVTAARTALSELRTACDKIDESDSDDSKKENRTRSIINTVGVVGGAVGGGMLIHKLVSDIQQTELDSARRAAYDEWMNEIGQHLKCYIGGQEAGYYGQIAVVEYE